MTDKTACDRFQRSLDAYLGDALASREREAARRHVSSCPDCLTRLTHADPLAVFLPLSAETPSPRVTDGFWEAVRAGIERDAAAGSRKVVPMPRQLRPGRLAVFAGRGFAPAAIAASLLVMVLAAWLAAVAPGTIVPGEPGSGGSWARVARAAKPAPWPAKGSVAAAGNPLPQTVEQVRTDDARDVQIYSMTWLDRDPAASGHDPSQVAELILIVDARLDL